MNIEAISSDTAVSIGFLLILVGGTWRLAVLLTEIKQGLKELAGTPKQLRVVSSRLQAVEADLNNLFAAVRAEDPSKLFEVMRVIPRFRSEEDNDG
jgi:hypothetical protein